MKNQKEYQILKLEKGVKRRKALKVVSTTLAVIVGAVTIGESINSFITERIGLGILQILSVGGIAGLAKYRNDKLNKKIDELQDIIDEAKKR